MNTVLAQVGMHAQQASDSSTSVHAHHHLSANGPSGPLEIMLVAFGVVIVLLVTTYTIKFFVKPQERDPNHIKRRILRDDF